MQNDMYNEIKNEINVIKRFELMNNDLLAEKMIAGE
jgi:hypothetical protein